MNALLTPATYERITSTIDRMLTDRGYSAIQGMNNVYETSSERVLVVVLTPENQEKQDGIDVFKQIVKDMELGDIHHSIVASYNGFTHHVTAFQQEIAERNEIEVFRFHELTSPLVDHWAVPPHLRIEEDERADLFRKLGIRDSNAQHVLPALFVTDPVARYYRYRIGDVIRIERLTGDIYYRIVTPPVN